MAHVNSGSEKQTMDRRKFLKRVGIAAWARSLAGQWSIHF